MPSKPQPPTELTAAPPALALFTAGPIAILRIHDMAFAEVVSAVVKTLPAAITSLMLVTPTDTKMFALKNGKASYADGTGNAKVSGTLHVALPAEDVGEAHTDDTEESDPQAEVLRLAAEGDAAAARAGLEEAQAEAATAETPAARRRALKKIRDAETAPAGDPCRRCGGSGQVGVIMEGGSPTQAACSVCRGAGVIKRFGERRR